MNNPPTTLGQYQIIREIARSNDIVYEAYDPLMNRRVAIKELAMPGGTSSQQREDRISRFKREAQAAGTLAHPNIMTVYSFAEDGGRLYMAMEYLDGHNLRNEIDTKGFLPADRAIEVAIEILRGLSHAHDKGVIHRDIKPDNVQILSSGAIKITDFGIARLTFQPNLTMDGQVFGTPSYMSPEQVVGREIDARSDIFSVGVVLYEMLGGQKPFAGDSVVSITYAIMNKEPAPISQASHSLWPVIARALDKSPQMRYPSATAMIEALEEATRPSAGAVLPSMPYHVPTPMAGANAGVIQAPYNPYAPPANQTPYGAPQMGGAPVPPPIVHPYNPYVQGGGGQYPPHTPGAMPGPLPVYYPPPPRPPLISAETKVFLKKLAVAIVVLGTLFALVLVGIQEIANAFRRSQAETQDRQVENRLVTDSSKPIDQRIQEYEELRGKLKSQTRIDEVNRNIAVLYEQMGKTFEGRGDYTSAELSYKKSTELDPANPAFYTNLGQLYASGAQNTSDPNQQLTLWQLSGQMWQQAAQRESDGSRRGSYGEAAALGYFRCASSGMQSGALSRSDARRMLNDAIAAAPPDSDIVGQIRDLLATLR